MSWCLQNSKKDWLESVLIYWDPYEWFGRAFLRSQRQRSQRVESVPWPLQMKQKVSNETFLDSDIYKIHLIFRMSLLKFEYLWCSVTNGAGGKKLHQGGDVESWATYWLCPSGDTNWKFQWVPVCHTEPSVLLVRENLSLVMVYCLYALKSIIISDLFAGSLKILLCWFWERFMDISQWEILIYECYIPFVLYNYL